MNPDLSSSMNLDEARLIAGAATAADLNAPGPELSVALEVLRKHPDTLAAWVQERRIDECIASAFSTISPPPGLRAQILAAHTAQQRTHPRRRFLLAWAAGLTVVSGLGITTRWFFGRRSPPVPTGFGAFAAAAAHFLDSEWDHVFEHSSSNLHELQRFLETSGASGAMEPGGRFDELVTIGCRRFHWRGQVAVLVCFRTRGGTAMVHVVSVARMAVGTDAAESTSLFQEGRWHAASWIRGERAYVALSDRMDRDSIFGVPQPEDGSAPMPRPG